MTNRPLYSERKRQQERAERLAAGEGVTLTRVLSKDVRTKLLYAMADNCPGAIDPDLEGEEWPDVANRVRGIVSRAWGRSTGLSKAGHRLSPYLDLNAYIINEATDEEVLETVEAWFDAIRESVEHLPGVPLPPAIRMEKAMGPDLGTVCIVKFHEQVNAIFDQHDIAFQVIGEEVLDRESMAMHADVIAPALSILRSDPRLAKVEAAFQAALRELKPGGDSADAITDAGTALQEMLMAAGAKGKSLGPLLTNARKSGLLGPYDSKLAEGMEKIGDWVSADRNTRGDAHSGASEADSDDAWLAIHVAGALIVRLSKRL